MFQLTHPLLRPIFSLNSRSKSIDDIMVNGSAAREPPLADQAEDIGTQDIPMPDAPTRQAASGDAPSHGARRRDVAAPGLPVQDTSKQARVGQDIGDIEIPLEDEGDQVSQGNSNDI